MACKISNKLVNSDLFSLKAKVWEILGALKYIFEFMLIQFICLELLEIEQKLNLKKIKKLEIVKYIFLYT